MNQYNHGKHSRFAAVIVMLLAVLWTGHVFGASSGEVRQFKNLRASSVAPGAQTPFEAISPGGRITSNTFLVPIGKNFVVTEVTIVPDNPSAGTNLVTLIQDPADAILGPRHTWAVSNESSAVMSYPTGIVIGAGSQLKIFNGILFGTVPSDGAITVWLNGYLVSNGKPINPILFR
jgi:hypothetical protein